MREKVTNDISERLQVPGLVGNKCPHLSLSAFLLSNTKKVEMEILEA